MKEEVKIDHWSSGFQCYEFPMVNGLRHGLCKWWNSDGSIDMLFSMKTETKNGVFLRFLFDKERFD